MQGMIPGMCVAFRAVRAADLRAMLDPQLALALEQQLTAALASRPNLAISDEDFVALLAERRELMDARDALRATERAGAPVTSMTGT